MIFLIVGMSTPIPIVTVGNTTSTIDDGDESSFKIRFFIAFVCRAWSCVNSLFSGFVSPLNQPHSLGLVGDVCPHQAAFEKKIEGKSTPSQG